MKRGKPLQRKTALARRAFRRERDTLANAEYPKVIAGGPDSNVTVLTPGASVECPVCGKFHLDPNGYRRCAGLPSPPRHRSVSPASREQRTKAREGCRVHGAACGNSTPAHVVDRSLGGCNEPECVVPLCIEAHRAYDEGTLDLSPYLSNAEAAHAVAHLGLFRALRRITNRRWVEQLGPETRF